MQLSRNRSSRAPSLPSWEDLCTHTWNADASDGEFQNKVKRLKERRPTWGYQVARVFVRSILRQPCYTKMLRFGWGDIIDMMADQVVRNRELLREEMSSPGSAPLSDRASKQLFRPFNQMPCTRGTAQRRVAKVRELLKPEDPILLLGDDDLVSVELALAGFKNVTAVDIDPKVLEEIQRLCKDMDLTVRTVQQDLTKPAPASLYAPYELVLFDPEYSLAGVTFFLDAAMELTRGRSGTRMLLSVHLMSLLRGGLPELQALFDRHGLEVREFHQGFNAYPAPSRLKGLIHLANRIVIGSKALATEGYAFPYLLSDSILLRKP